MAVRLQFLDVMGRRSVRFCCVCCCRWCCVTSAPFPEEILGSTRMTLLRIVVSLLSLGVAASCAYGMSKINPKLVDSGLGVIDSTKVPYSLAFCMRQRKTIALVFGCPLE